MGAGIGGTHRFALIVPDEEAQLVWCEKLVRAGLLVTPVLDRVYFKSIYSNDPDGHIVELATVGQVSPSMKCRTSLVKASNCRPGWKDTALRSS